MILPPTNHITSGKKGATQQLVFQGTQLHVGLEFPCRKASFFVLAPLIILVVLSKISDDDVLHSFP